MLGRAQFAARLRHWRATSRIAARKIYARRLISMDSNVESSLHRLAARTALLLLPTREYPGVIERVADFLQDRGAVGLLLVQYKATNSLEEMALSFWRSRTERSAARLEDIVTAALIATLSGIIAGIAVEMWKGNPGLIKKLFRSSDKELLQHVSREERRLREDLAILLLFSVAKLNGKGIADPNIAARLYAEIERGVTFQIFYERNRDVLQHEPKADFLSYATDVARGVVLTELRRAEGFPISLPPLAKNGLPLSPYLGFGEAISLVPVSDLGLGPLWPKLLTEKLNSKRLYPNFWPSGVSRIPPSPKVLILDEMVFHILRPPEYSVLLTKCGGIVSMDSGLTSHLGVFCRGLGIGAITCPLSDEERATAKFVLFQDGRLRVYRDLPDLVAYDFETMMASVSRGPSQHPGD